jgi:RNA recognition motif-containing protein
MFRSIFFFNFYFFQMNIFVARLDYSVQEDELKDAFEAYGEVSSVKIIMDRETGRSKGFGFVEMDNDGDGNNAIEALDGASIKGREIAVKEARPQEERGSNNRGGGGGSYNRDRY